MGKSNVSMESILQAMTDQVFAIDDEERFFYFHSLDPELLYLKPEEFIGRRVSEVMPPEFRPQFEEAVSVNRQGRLAEYDYSLPIGDGERWFHARLSPLMENGEYRGSVAVVRDITRLVQGQEKQRRLEAELAQAQKLESLGLLAGSVAHDFNNLLMSMLGHADLALLEAEEPEKVKQHMERIRSAAQQAAELTQQLLAYAGRGERASEQVDLGQLVLEMGELLRVNLPGGISLLMDCMGSAAPVQADPTQVRQIVMNLVTNAMEAMDGREGAIRLSCMPWESKGEPLSGCILSEAVPAGTYTVLQVEDQGCGMDHEIIQRIFEPFYSTKFTGRGVGLAAVLGMVRAHQGFIQVKSQKDRGTTFRIGLPAAELKTVDTRVEKNGTNGQALSGRVLLVDDDESVRAIAASMLGHLGLQVDEAKDGSQALKLIQTSNEAFSLVLLDMNMPGLSGLQVLKRIRLLRADLPVLLSSGYGQESDTLQEEIHGPVAFISKPYRLKKLHQALQQLLANK